MPPPFMTPFIALVLAGLLIASLGYSPAFALIASLMAVAALVFAVLVRHPEAV